MSVEATFTLLKPGPWRPCDPTFVIIPPGCDKASLGVLQLRNRTDRQRVWSAVVPIVNDNLPESVAGGGRTLNESPRATDAAPWLAACGDGICRSGHAVDWPYMSFLGSGDLVSSDDEPFCNHQRHSVSKRKLCFRGRQHPNDTRTNAHHDSIAFGRCSAKPHLSMF